MSKNRIPFDPDEKLEAIDEALASILGAMDALEGIEDFVDEYRGLREIYDALAAMVEGIEAELEKEARDERNYQEWEYRMSR